MLRRRKRNADASADGPFGTGRQRLSMVNPWLLAPVAGVSAKSAPRLRRPQSWVQEDVCDVNDQIRQGEDDGEKLTEKELMHNCIFLLNAGHETTTNLIGNGLVALLQHPAQKQRLLDHPEMIKTAVEEMLRYESSNQLGNRMTTEPVELGGIAMPAGTPVTLCIGAANRDPAQFPDPETFDIGRTPNRHLAFASGAHQCAGMALARLEGAIAVSRFLKRFPGYALDGEPVRGGRVRFRGFLSVPCRVG